MNAGLAAKLRTRRVRASMAWRGALYLLRVAAASGRSRDAAARAEKRHPRRRAVPRPGEHLGVVAAGATPEPERGAGEPQLQGS